MQHSSKTVRNSYMKLTPILLINLLFLTGFKGFAQFSVDVHGGVNHSSYTSKPMATGNSTGGYKPGYQYGLYFNYQFGQLGLGSQALIVNKPGVFVTKQKSFTRDVREEYDPLFFEIPVLLNYRVLSHKITLDLAGGPFVGRIISGTV